MANGAPELRLIPGGGDMVEAVEDLLEQIREGTVVGVVLCGITEKDGGSCGWTWAYKDGISCPWARLLAIVSTAQHDLVNEGLADG